MNWLLIQVKYTHLKISFNKETLVRTPMQSNVVVMFATSSPVNLNVMQYVLHVLLLALPIRYHRYLVVNLFRRESDRLFGAQCVQVQRTIFAFQLAAYVGLPSK